MDQGIIQFFIISGLVFCLVFASGIKRKKQNTVLMIRFLEHYLAEVDLVDKEDRYGTAIMEKGTEWFVYGSDDKDYIFGVFPDIKHPGNAVYYVSKLALKEGRIELFYN